MSAIIAPGGPFLFLGPTPAHTEPELDHMSAKAAVLKRPHISKKEEEEKTERKRRRPIGVATGALLIERTEAAKVLGNCSISTLIRLETAGKLTPHKLAGSPLGKTFYEHTEVVALSKGGDDAR